MRRVTMPDRAPRRRAVVAGLGAVSSLGNGAHAFAEAIRAGRSGVSPIRGFDTRGFPHTYAGEVHGFEPARLLRNLDAGEWGRTRLFAASASRLAVSDAGVDPDRLPAARAGSAMGTTNGESARNDELFWQCVHSGLKDLDPALAGPD